jgi:hypothetical protein
VLPASFDAGGDFLAGDGERNEEHFPAGAGDAVSAVGDVVNP